MTSTSANEGRGIMRNRFIEPPYYNSSMDMKQASTDNVSDRLQKY